MGALLLLWCERCIEGQARQRQGLGSLDEGGKRQGATQPIAGACQLPDSGGTLEGAHMTGW